MAPMQRSAGPGSFPLSADELLDIESWATAFVSADGLAEDGKATPGHHRASHLLDGNSSSSSSGGSSHSGSFDATTPAAAPEQDLPSSTSKPAETSYQDPSPAATNPSTTPAAAEWAAGVLAAFAEQQSQAPPAAPTANTTNSSSRSSLGGHAAPSTLQLPDFSAFMLPEECAFVETTTEDALATPTPHTPVVNNIFAETGLPVVSARTCRPHYSSGGGGSSTTSSSNSSGGSSNSSNSSGGGGGSDTCDDSGPNTAAGSNGSTGGSSSSMQQLGTCRALLVDNGDDEFELDPFPAAVVPSSPSSHRHHHAPGSGSGGGWQTYAGLEMLQSGGWESGPGFTSLLCRRTLSTVSEATHEGLDSESASSTPSATRTGAAPGPPQPDQQQQQEQQGQPGQQEQQQQQQQQEQQEEQAETAAGDPDLTADADTAAVLLELCFGTNQILVQPPRQQQQQQQPQGAACQDMTEDSTVAAEGAPALTAAAAQWLQIVMAADIQQQQQQQQQQDEAGLESAAEAIAATVETAASDKSAAVHAADDAFGSNEPVVVEITAHATATAAAAPVAGSADAAVEDVWEAANKQRLQQLQQLQEQAEQQVARLSYPAAEAQLLAALSSSSTGSRTFLQLDSNQTPAAAAAGCLQHKQPQGLLQRLLRLCGCGRSSGGVASQAQQCQQVLQLAQTQFSDDSSLHLALLQAVHCAYTGQVGHVPRCGPHWAVLGFQGDDPATDLRGARLLGLLQLLHLHWHDPAAAGRIWELSQSTKQEFPLAIVSFSVTTWALGALRAGRLDAAAAQLGGSHLAAANLFHSGAMYEFHSRWLRDKRTMLDSGVVLKQLECYCSSHCKQLLQLARRDGRS